MTAKGMPSKAKTLEVKLTESALSDLFEINDYYLQTVSDAISLKLIEKLESAVYSLAEQPMRGHIPRELRDFGITEFLEIIVDLYRIVYSVLPEMVVVYCVLDSRRDLDAILHYRLLR